MGSNSTTVQNLTQRSPFCQSLTVNQGWTYRDRVTQLFAGCTVLNYYSYRYRHSSREQWRDRILAGQILCNGAAIAPETPLQNGQNLTYHRPPWIEPSVPLAFQVLYQDADLLAIAKPAGLPVLPGGSFVQNTLLHLLQQRHPQDTPVPVHRLGRGTSGIMLLARSPLAKAHLSRQMRQSSQKLGKPRSLRKLYRALVGPFTPGHNLGDRFVLTAPIGKVPHPELGYLYGAHPDGSPAHSDGRVLTRWRDRTLLEMDIHTGRPHQIRIHLAAAGYPLLGDPLYLPGGSPRLRPAPGQTKLPVPSDIGYWLHAWELTFIHPRTEKSLAIACEPPSELQPH